MFAKRFSDQLFSVKILLMLMQYKFEFMFSSPEIDIVKKNEEKMVFLALLVSKQRRTPSVECHMQINMK